MWCCGPKLWINCLCCCVTHELNWVNTLTHITAFGVCNHWLILNTVSSLPASALADIIDQISWNDWNKPVDEDCACTVWFSRQISVFFTQSPSINVMQALIPRDRKVRISSPGLFTPTDRWSSVCGCAWWDGCVEENSCPTFRTQTPSSSTADGRTDAARTRRRRRWCNKTSGCCSWLCACTWEQLLQVRRMVSGNLWPELV